MRKLNQLKGDYMKHTDYLIKLCFLHVMGRPPIMCRFGEDAMDEDEIAVAYAHLSIMLELKLDSGTVIEDLRSYIFDKYIQMILKHQVMFLTHVTNTLSGYNAYASFCSDDFEKYLDEIYEKYKSYL